MLFVFYSKNYLQKKRKEKFHFKLNTFNSTRMDFKTAFTSLCELILTDPHDFKGTKLTGYKKTGANKDFYAKLCQQNDKIEITIEKLLDVLI